MHTDVFFGGNGVQPASSVDLFAEGIAPRNQVAPSPMLDDSGFFPTLEKEAILADAYSAEIQDAVLEAFCWRMVRCFPVDSLSPAFRRRSIEQEFIVRLYRVLEAQVTGSRSVDELSAQMKMSKRSLSMKCRSLLGDSPARLVARFKVQKAVQLLMHTDRPVKEIAFDLGFENPYHFSRVFKTFYGSPPSSLRKDESG